jgi:hypothetical protein
VLLSYDLSPYGSKCWATSQLESAACISRGERSVGRDAAINPESHSSPNAAESLAIVIEMFRYLE